MSDFSQITPLQKKILLALRHDPQSKISERYIYAACLDIGKREMRSNYDFDHKFRIRGTGDVVYMYLDKRMSQFNVIPRTIKSMLVNNTIEADSMNFMEFSPFVGVRFRLSEKGRDFAKRLYEKAEK